VRIERLTLTRYLSSRVREVPFYRLHKVHTGFGADAVVVAEPTEGHP
jgi:hypothetical protein